MTASCHEILPNIWLGDMHSSVDVHFIKEKNINCVFNCTINQPFHINIEYKYRIPVKDNLQENEIYLMYCLLDKTINLMKKHTLAGDNILVHCFAGRQRSVCIILAFLMKFGDMSLKNAFDLIKTKREVCGKPRLNFYKALKEYEANLN